MGTSGGWGDESRRGRTVVAMDQRGSGGWGDESRSGTSSAAHIWIVVIVVLQTCLFESKNVRE